MNFKKLMALLLAAAMIFALAIPAGAVGTDEVKYSFEKVDNDVIKAGAKAAAEKVEEVEQPALYADSDIVRVSIVLGEQSTIDAGFPIENIAKNASAMSYRAGLKANQNAVADAISAQALNGAELDVAWNLTLVANIISANVPYGSIEAIKAVDGVKDVFVEKQYAPAVASIGGDDPNMGTSAAQIGSAAAYAAGYTGAGSRVAIIDTGLDTDHRSFDEGGYLYSLAKNAEAAGMEYDEYVESLDLLDAEEVNAVWTELNFITKYHGASSNTYFTQKVPYGANYVDKGVDITHDNDSQGEHGSHVAGIAAANAYVKEGDEYVPAMDTVKVQGVAPDAQFLIMKVFGKGGGAYDADYMVAIEDAIILGADSVNLSLGSANAGPSRENNDYQHIMDSLVESGTLVVMSAGNSGPWFENTTYGYLYNDGVNYATGGSPGSYTNSLTVASVDNDGITGTYFKIADSNYVYTETSGYTNSPMSTIAGEHEYVFYDHVGADGNGASLFTSDVAGKVAFCYRGTSSFYQKMDAAAKAGAIACIVVNNQPGTINMDLSSATTRIPCVSITQAQGNAIKLASEQGEGCYTGTMIIGGAKDLDSQPGNSEYYTMSSFSSWGVPGSLELKPDITAPGGSIYSVNGAVKGGQAYELMSGTSMAAPQVTGMAGVLGQAIRERGLEEQTGLSERQLQNSLLMSTSVPMIEADSGNYYSVFNQGSGLANIGAAANAQSYIFMDEGSNAGAADGKIKAELGDDPDKDGVYEIGFTINNLTEEDQKYALDAKFFTQDVFDGFGDGSVYFLDTWTADISAGVAWFIDGEAQEVTGDISNCDFNGDGVVDINDVQALLDYDVKVDAEITNEKYADVSGDGYITAFDAYELLKILNAGLVEVPAGESVSVYVTVALSDAQKAFFDEYYPVGAYIEGYIFASQMPTPEGVKGTAHSIPVLGFYGNWSDSSMFDVGTYNSRLAGEEVRDAYLAALNGDQGNILTVKYADDPASAYAFGGNPVIADETYLPERDAINSKHDDFAKLNFASIRNASDSALYITDAEGEIVGDPITLGEVDAAYYYTNKSAWYSYQWSVGANGMIKNLEENEAYALNLTLVPEYYTIDGEWSFDELGAGATMSYGFTVDNTAPELLEVSYSLMSKEFTVIAQDNQYIAGIILYGTDGETILGGSGSVADVEPGEIIVYTIPVEALDDGKALLAVYDYALNQSTFKLIAAGASAPVESVTLNKSKIELLPGNTAKLKAHVEPFEADETIVWTSSDEEIAVVDENGLVTAIAKGSCVITATSAKDATKFAECAVSVVTVPVYIEGALQDADGNPEFFSWDLENEDTWTPGAILPTDINAFEEDLAHYYPDANGEDCDAAWLQNSEGYMYLINMSNGEALGVSEAATAFGAPMNGLVSPAYYNATRNQHMIYGLFNTYLLYSNSPLENTFNSGWEMSAYGVGNIAAATWAGRDSRNRDVLVAIDTNGMYWEFYTNASTGKLASFGSLPTDLNLDWPTYGDSQYCSLTSDQFGNFYLSYFTGETNEIYQLTISEDGTMFEGKCLKNVGQDVWPTFLYYAELAEEEEEADPVERVAKTFVQNEIMAGEETSFIGIAPAAAVAEGTLNAAPATAGIQSTAKIAADQSAVVVELTIKDAEGNDVAANSADLAVEFDPEILAVESVEVNAQFKSYEVSNDYGVVYIGLVDEDEIPAGAVAATVTFSVLKDAPTEIVAETATWNDEISDFEDVESFDLHICPSFKFEDVTENDWFHEAIDYVLLKGYMSGISETEFAPNASMTRAQLVTVLHNIAGEPSVEEVVNPFEDVTEEDWFYAPVLWAYNAGITSGVSETEFDPEGELTRAQLVVFLENFAIYCGEEIGDLDVAVLGDFADAESVVYWAVESFTWAVTKGIVSGIEIDGDFYLMPAQTATRAQLATIIANL